LVNFLQNHDQISVAPGGRRLHQLTSPGRLRALTSLLLLAPGTPMLFQGDEFAASAPFLYFADHEESLARLVREGRAAYLAQFASLADPAAQALIPDPSDPQTFARSQLDNAERERNTEAVRLHRDLIALRRSGAGLTRPRVVSAALTEHALALRADVGGRATLLLVNLGADLPLPSNPEGILAAPVGAAWSARWSSDAVEYGGPGVPEAGRRGALLPGESAVLLAAQSAVARRSGPV
jgi:maltooligosyltrehalose trehalohydrolase